MVVALLVVKALGRASVAVSNGHAVFLNTEETKTTAMNTLPTPLFDGLKLDMPITVIYIERSYNTELNSFIQSNYQLLVDEYNQQNINFIYLPFLLQNQEYKNILDYNHPYLNTDNRNGLLQEIYNGIIQKYNISVADCAVVSLEDDYAKTLIICKEIDFSFNLQEQFLYLPIDIRWVILEREKQEYESLALRLRNGNRDNLSRECMFNIVANPNDISDEERIDSIDLIYDELEFEKEIHRNIDKLIERGALELIGMVIERLQTATQKLSRLIITKDFRIFLEDYGMKEIEMSPLPKSLFILFLNHPEGIPFKRLSDHHDELLSIYMNITRNDGLEQSVASIKAMTDPLNNSINEKCSRIRASFLKVIPDNLAENYYITGYRGDAKKIELDRELVQFQ